MKIQKLLLTTVLSMSLGFVTFAQTDTTTSTTKDDECTRYKAIAGYAYKAQEYEKVVRSYIKAIEECGGALEMVFYDPFIYSIRKSMSNTKDPKVEAAYLDTLIMVYEGAQLKHGMQKKWQTHLAYSYLKQGKPGNMKKADSAYQIGVHFEKEGVNKGYLQQYYANLYNLWVQEQDETIKASYKKRLISEYFTLSEYANKGKMGATIIEFLGKYIDNVVTDCVSVLPEINQFIQQLPQELEAKKATVKNFMSLLEEQECTDSKEYVMLVDTIIAIDPSVDAVIAKAKLLSSQGKITESIHTFKNALTMTEDPAIISEIEYDIARSYYNVGSYRSAHDAGIAVSGKNSGKGYEIAARSVHALMNSCGVSTFDRKANNYYAVELAQKTGDASLVNWLKGECPSGDDIFNADKSVGGTVTLSCWNKTYTITKY